MDKEILLIKYFEKQLSAEERIRLNELVQTDPDFAADFAFRKQLQVALHKNERAALKQVLERHEAGAKRVVFSTRNIAIAASFLVIAAISVFLYLEKNTKEKLYTQYYSAYPNIIMPITRGGVNDLIDSTKKAAFIAYEAQHYAEAKMLFDNMSTYPNAAYAYFYSGICAMENGSFNEAVKKFSQYLNTNNKWQLADDAMWYQALCYLQLENNDAAIAILTKLKIAGKKYDRESETLLKKLN